MFLRSFRIYKALVKSETRCYPTVKQEDRVQNEKSVSNAKKGKCEAGPISSPKICYGLCASEQEMQSDFAAFVFIVLHHQLDVCSCFDE